MDDAFDQPQLLVCIHVGDVVALVRVAEGA